MAEHSHLKAPLNTWQLWGIAVGLVISGEYFGWSYGWASAGTLGFLVTTILVATMYIAFIFSFTELTTAIPNAGGPFAYAQRAFGELGGYIAAAATLVELLFAPPAIALAHTRQHQRPAAPGHENDRGSEERLAPHVSGLASLGWSPPSTALSSAIPGRSLPCRALGIFLRSSAKFTPDFRLRTLLFLLVASSALQPSTATHGSPSGDNLSPRTSSLCPYWARSSCTSQAWLHSFVCVRLSPPCRGPSGRGSTHFPLSGLCSVQASVWRASFTLISS